MLLEERTKIVSTLECVDFVIPFEIENDLTVIEALKVIRPNIFAKGGDRIDRDSIPEWDFCAENGIKVELNVGKSKVKSSTEYLIEWAEFWNQRQK
jgi:bifunctional ADP-heptose synthase (sugar kinase/adenylyltransferase)